MKKLKPPAHPPCMYHPGVFLFLFSIVWFCFSEIQLLFLEYAKTLYGLDLFQDNHSFLIKNIVYFFVIKDNSGKISLEELAKICTEFNLPVEDELLKSLLTYCDADKDGQINYTEFANFLNWKDQMPSGMSLSVKEVIRHMPMS